MRNARVGRLIPAVIMAAALAAGCIASLAAQQQHSRSAPAKSSDRAPARGNKFGVPSPRPRTPGAIRIATYNTLNLFDDVDDPSLQGEFDDIKNTTSDDRCRAMAAAIKAVDADIIALQEVESLAALKWFRDKFLPGAGYKWLASIDVGYYRGVECSVMSRFEITDAKVWSDESLDDVKRAGLGWTTIPPDHRSGLKFQRSPLMVKVKVSENYELTVFSLHHKAGRDFDWHREAEALQITEYLDELRRADPSRNVVVMGDFNAAPWDKSVRVYLEDGMIDTMAFRCTERDNPESRLYKTHESDRVLDLILLNSAAHRELVLGSPFVLGTLYPGDSYDYTKDPYPPGYASDHYPVAIELMPKDVQ